VVENADGTFWTGSWVVDIRHAELASKVGAHVALHENKASKSYRQGLAKAWRRSPRDREVFEIAAEIEEGVEFLVEPTQEPLTWAGEGAGEKGYRWSSDGQKTEQPE
jgi:hypothetical protein